ncbi:MAG: extracellular solute-binding protein [Capsulimonadaceae bacterium]|nr:extracellular solute-binding protein [Capsulimonadaceae bacterium]
MKQLFAIIFFVLVVLSIVAIAMEPHGGVKGKIPLVWTSDDNPARREQFALFNKMYPKYDCVLDPSNSGMEKVIVQSLAGNGPDVLDCYGPEQMDAYVAAGVAWDVTDELKKRGVDVPHNVWSVNVGNCIKNGRVYGAPTNSGANALWVNRDLFKNAGLPLPKGPWTWDQFIPLAEKLTLHDASGRITQYGLLVDWYQWPQFVFQYGGHVYSPDGTRCVLNTPQAAAGLQFLHDLVYKYHVMPSPAEQDAMATSGGWGSGTITLFGNGHSAMALGGRWWLCTLRKEPSLHLWAVECPYPKGGLRVFEGSGKGTIINAKSPRREDALNVLIYLQSKEFSQLINHQADALGPVPKYCMGDDYLHDPAYPQEDFNAVWRDVLKYAVPTEISPYVNPVAASTIIEKQIDLIKGDQKPVALALKDATDQVNAAIRLNLQKDDKLRARYLKATGGKLP